MICEHLILIRNRLGLSQREFAEKLNISKSTYSRWETGEKIIPLKHLINLCNYTNTSCDYIFGLSENKKNLKKKIDLNIQSIGERLKQIRIKNKLSQKEFAKAINTVQSVISAYENGYVLIQTSFLYDICVKFHVSADYILGLKEKY